MTSKGNTAGVLFDATTGYFEWTPGQDVVDNQGGESRAYTFAFRASDGEASTTQTVQVRVLDRNRETEVLVAKRAVKLGDTLRNPVAAGVNPSGTVINPSGIRFTDADGAAQTAALAIAITGLPEGAVYDAAARIKKADPRR